MPSIQNQALCQQLYNQGLSIWKAYEEKRNKSVIFNESKSINYDYYQSIPFKQVLSSAEQGDQNAQCYVGSYYLNQGNNNAALNWLHKSAEQGCVDAMAWLGKIYTYGTNGVDSDYDVAEKWLKKATSIHCSWNVCDAMMHYCIKSDTYDNSVECVKWASLAMEFFDDLGDRKEYAIQVLNTLQALWGVLYEMRETDPEKLSADDFQEMESLSLQSYVWYSYAYDCGARVAADDIENPAEILCQIGEAAMILDKPYAKATLREAMAQGSDYAAVLLVPEAMEQAIGYKQNVREAAARTGPWLIEGDLAMPPIPSGMNKAAESYVREYYPCVSRAAQNSDWHERQARSLYRLGFFYLLGLCCRRDITAAHDCMQKSANLGFTSAKKILPRFKKKFIGWDYQ